MVICAFHNTIVEPVSKKNILTKDANKNRKRRKRKKDAKEKRGNDNLCILVSAFSISCYFCNNFTVYTLPNHQYKMIARILLPDYKTITFNAIFFNSDSIVDQRLIIHTLSVLKEGIDLWIILCPDKNYFLDKDSFY